MPHGVSNTKGKTTPKKFIIDFMLGGIAAAISKTVAAPI